jgi:hypothetical protein
LCFSFGFGHVLVAVVVFLSSLCRKTAKNAIVDPRKNTTANSKKIAPPPALFLADSH